jgi:hypothetical protein
MTTRSFSLGRRELLKLGLAAGALGLVPREGDAQTAWSAPDPRTRKLLFVVCAHGGASIVDSFLPLLDYDAGTSAQTLNCFPERLIEQPSGSAFRCVTLLDSYQAYPRPSYPIARFVAQHGRDMVVIGHDVGSVNHLVGQARALSGAGVDRGRTIMESAALRHGAGLPLPNCNMAMDGYVRHGVDASVPVAARHEMVMTPLLFGAGTHGFQGVPDAPSAAGVARARKAREQVDHDSAFRHAFPRDARLTAYLRARRDVPPRLEQANLVEKLLLIDPRVVDARYGLARDPLAMRVRAQLPHIDSDRIQAQVGLAFLLAYHGASSALTLGFGTEPAVRPSGTIVGVPLGFDFAHSLHRVSQALMWSRTLEVVDLLIALLKSHDYLGDPALGPMWDRSLVYIATEFGRDKARPRGAESWGSGHDLNNGSVLISPLLKGNAVYGGVSPRTGQTYGFDPQTGRPDPNRKMSERDVYGIIAHALDIAVPSGLRYPGLVRAL